MTKEELITNQQLEIAELKQVCERNEKTISDIKYRFIGIGQPLNDNVLRFNKEQLLWCHRVLELIEELEY